MNAYVIDIESNNLYPFQSETWTIRIKKVGEDKWLKINPFKMKKEDVKKEVLDFLFEFPRPIIIGHNYLGFDGWVLWKDFDIDMHVGKDTIAGREAVFFDTLYASQYFLPDREGGHSLKSWGIRFGDHKIDYYNLAIELGIIPKGAPQGSEFCQWSPDMDIYCEKDCLITEQLFILLYEKLEKENTVSAFRLGQKTFFLQAAQGFTGFAFNDKRANELKPMIEKMICDLKEEVEPNLPLRPLKKSEEAFYTMPAKPYTKDGCFSANMYKFMEKHNARIVSDDIIEIDGKNFWVEAKAKVLESLPMNLEDQKELKDYFLENGWVPTMWNIQKDANGKAMRDEKKQVIKTSPKIQENGKICPNLLDLDGEIPKKVVKFLSLRNRLGVLNGWLGNKRLSWDGRLTAGASGIASTHRQKHTVIVNVPKAQDDVLLGKEYRSLFTVEEGSKLVGVDQAALEARCQGHYCVPMDTQALTKDGWKNYDELKYGEEILAYDSVSKTKKWTPMLEKIKFNDIEVFSLENNEFKVRATANHRWFIKQRDKKRKNFIDKVVEMKDLNSEHNIIVNAPMEDYLSGFTRGIKDEKYGQNWIKHIISKGLESVESFMEGFLIADGHWDKNKNSTTGRWKFTQNLGEHFEVALTSAYIASSGYLNVNYRKTKSNTIANVTLNRKSHLTAQKMRIKSVGVEDVWCPRTKYGSWVMRQGDVITITGNTYKYDNGESARELIEGDVHSKNAKAFYEEETKNFDIQSSDFDNSHPDFKPYRSKSKNGYYALMYGAAPPKLASTLGHPESKGKILVENFWKANPSLKQLKDNLEKFWKEEGDKKWIPAIDGRRLYSRSQHSLVNLLFQSAGAIIMDYALALFDMRMGTMLLDEKGRPFYSYKGYFVKRVSYHHDETQVEVQEGIEREVADILEWCMAEAGVRLKVKVPLIGVATIGKNWCETH